MLARYNTFNPYISNTSSLIPNIQNLNAVSTVGKKGGLLNLLSNLGKTNPTTASLGLAKKGINWSTLLSNTQKTLGVINQTIPTINQIKPIVNNAKTMFKLMNELKKPDEATADKINNIIHNNPNNNQYNNSNNYNQYDNQPNNSNTNNPKFFI